MKRISIFATVALGSVLFVSCKNEGADGLPIPKDAAIVVHINSSSISSKLSWDDMKKTTWFHDASENNQDSLARKIMDNPEASGIDTKSDLAFFMRKQGQRGYMVFEGKIKDAAAFQSLVKSMNKTGVLTKDDKLSSITSNDGELISWTNDKFIAMTDMPGLNAMNSFSYGNYQEKKFTSDSLKKFTLELLNLKADNSLEKDKRFATLLKEGGDVHFWMNAEQYASEMGGGMLSMLKLNMFFDGNASATTVNFDNGKITMKSKQYYGAEMTKILEKYDAKKGTTDLINRIPSKDVVAALSLNIPADGMKALMKNAGLDGMFNSFLGKYGFSFDELMQAYNGQMLLSVSDVKINAEVHKTEGTDYTYTTHKPDMNVLFATSVGNKAIFDKLVAIASDQAKQQMGAMPDVNFKVTNDWFAIGNKMESVDKFLAGGNSQLPFANLISGHPVGLFVDIHRIMEISKTTMGDSQDGLAAMDASMAMWKNLVVTGGEYKNGYVSMDMVVNLVDPNMNALKQINQYAEKLNAARKLRKVETFTPSDSTAVVAPVTPAQ